jgi:hypothetical protein
MSGRSPEHCVLQGPQGGCGWLGKGAGLHHNLNQGSLQEAAARSEKLRPLHGKWQWDQEKRKAWGDTKDKPGWPPRSAPCVQAGRHSLKQATEKQSVQGKCRYGHKEMPVRRLSSADWRPVDTQLLPLRCSPLVTGPPGASPD